MNERPFCLGHCGGAKLGLWAAILSATMLMINSPAFGGLGEDVSSLQADRVHLPGSLRTTQSEAFAVHEILAPTGIVVREYVSASGKVFAVTWHGRRTCGRSWPTISSST